jgi:KDO2-lipid IV(A) lauroyltransferase
MQLRLLTYLCARIMYYLLLILLYPLALLPLPCLYVLSDIVFVLLYHLLHYRRHVVTSNLLHAFPEKNKKEIRTIRRAFYHSFCDQWMETLKMLTISKEELNMRVTGNWEVFRQLDEEGKNTYALLGHTFNWEWANLACQYNCPQQFAGVYLPVKNKGFDRLMQQMRSRGGGWLISMKAKKAFQRLQSVRYIVGLIADQNPSNLNSALWLQFMRREAPFFKGPEQLARRARAAVVFAGIKKVKRGYYHIHLSLYTADASTLPDGKIMADYVAFMERQLQVQPANWLWSHKRWKYNRQ